MEHVVEVVQMRNQVLPEGDFSGAVVVPDPRLEADVKVELILRIVFGPGDLLEPICLRVDELGVLRDRFIRVAKQEMRNSVKRK